MIILQKLIAGKEAWGNFAPQFAKLNEKSTVAHKIGEGAIFPVGEPNDAFAKYFTGQSALKMLTTEGVPTPQVGFEPGCRNGWHIHYKGGHILLCTGGRGYYREMGCEGAGAASGWYQAGNQVLAWCGRGQLVFVHCH